MAARTELELENGTSPAATSTEKEEQSGSSQSDVNPIDWDGPDDPEMPSNWPKSKRWINTMAVSTLTLLTPFASSMIAPAVQLIMDDMGETNRNLGSFSVSIYLLGYTFWPFIPRPTQRALRASPSIPYLHVSFPLDQRRVRIVCQNAHVHRLPPANWTRGQEERGRAMAIWNMPVLLGPSLGPAVGAYVSRSLGWRWNFWLLVIMKETHPPALLKKKQKKLQKLHGTQHGSSALPSDTTNQLLKKSLARPLKMLFLSPIIFGLSLLTAIAYGTLYLLFTTVSEVFQTRYGIVTNVGLVYLGFGSGQIVGLFLFGLVSDPILKRLASKGGEMKPEYRLPLMIPCSAIIPIGLLVYGWTAQFRVFWFVPVIGTFLIGFGMITVFSSVSTYLVDAFPVYAASATAANTVLRSVGGALLPLAGPKMYEALGQGWGNTLLAGLSLGMIGMIIVAYKYGERLRTKVEY
ncbi:hypothetical protein CEP52_007019 [Fusarium oligoseptatum]|uniref:Major facilitator superfamily (MFS) profile domain-containing protein n=1 Tax=Fusarium oligoseptatum TaxID=2604345 RepID=A0A428TQ94_9HYPO|nr:hypothetical protein CEP52_007019 [Fusarium oligoseptatum]